VGIRDWAEEDRPRERLLRLGAKALTDAELLAIFLRTGVAGKSAVDLARELLAEHDGLRGLFALSPGEEPPGHRPRVKGFGPAKRIQLAAVLELARRHFESGLKRDTVLTSPDTVRHFLSLELRGEPREVFAALFLDQQHRLIAFERLFFGSVAEAAVYPREVARRALVHNAAAVIVAHNHPSGVAEPSRADQAITRRLAEALALLEVRLLDHLVVGDEVVSLAERGWL